MHWNTNENIGSATAPTLQQERRHSCRLKLTPPPRQERGHARQVAPIPMDQLGAVAGKQYQGDGLSVAATPEGARLRCVFQKLEGEATPEGLWLTSTSDAARGERFRVVARAVGRQEGGRASSRALTSSGNMRESGLTRTLALPAAGHVEVAGQVARFIRPGLIEEYSVSMDGVRQDFLVERPPLNSQLLAASERSADGSTLNQLRVELEVTGARVEPLANGARLVLAGSGRKIAYSRLRATDARGKELAARMVVASGILPDVEGGHPAARIEGVGLSAGLLQETTEATGLEATALRQAGMPAATCLAVLVDDAGAEYPVRIDPTFSDENWISLNPSIPGTDGEVRAAVVDAAGNLYIGGDFTVVGDIIANYVAKWNGSSWSALGWGMGRADAYAPVAVSALAVSGSNVYAAGDFTTAGGVAANQHCQMEREQLVSPGVGDGEDRWL